MHLHGASLAHVVEQLRTGVVRWAAGTRSCMSRAEMQPCEPKLVFHAINAVWYPMTVIIADPLCLNACCLGSCHMHTYTHTHARTYA